MFQRPDLTGIGVIIPGSEIPKWFRHQSMGASMDFHEGLLDFMGIAVCAIFVRRQHQPLHQSPSKILGFCVSWCYSVIGCTGECEGRVIPEEFVEIDSYNLWLKYFPFKKGNFEERLSPIHTNGFSWITVKCETYSAGLEVTSAGLVWLTRKPLKISNKL